MATLPDLRQLQAQIAELQAQNEALKAKAMANGIKKISMKVSENKGCLSVYGIGRYPVTLYAQQWQRLLAVADDIHAFIAANKDELSWKE